MFCGLIVSLLIMDWLGSITLAGLIQWQRLKLSHRFWLGCVLLLLFPMIPGIYLVRYCLFHRYRCISVHTVPYFSVVRAKIGLAIGGLITVCLAIAFMIISSSTSTNQIEPLQTTTIQNVNSISTQGIQVPDVTATETIQPQTPTPVAMSAQETPIPVAFNILEDTSTPMAMSTQETPTPVAIAPDEPVVTIKATPQPPIPTPVLESTQPQTAEPTFAATKPTPVKTLPNPSPW